MARVRLKNKLKKQIVELEKRNQALIEALSNDDTTFSAACDSYTKAAKDVAATMNAERIRRSFADKVDKDGISTESVEEKVQHAADVRSWLAPWNLALTDKLTSIPVQLYAQRNATKTGMYLLQPLGKVSNKRPFGAWERVIGAVSAPTLIDISDVFHKRDKPKQR